MDNDKKTREQLEEELEDLHRQLEELKRVKDIKNVRDRRFKLLIENASDIITIIDGSGAILYTTPSAQRISGFSIEELKGRNILALLHPWDFPAAKEGLAKLLESPGASNSTSVRMQKKDGTYIYLEAMATNFLHEPGIEGIILNSRDVTTWKIAEKALSDEKERLAITLKSIGEGVITTDTEGRIVLMNKAAEELTGWTQEDAKSRCLKEVFHIVDQKSKSVYQDPLKKVLRQRKSASMNRTVLVDKKGGERIISDTGSYIYDRNNMIIGAVLVFRDITDKLRIEEEMIKASKIESIGILAGGIAHDFNNILTTILGNASLAMLSVKAGNKDKVLDRLYDIERASLQAKELTQQLLTFAKGGEPIIKTICIAQMLRETASFVLSGSNISCELSIPADIWPVEADEGQIGQVVNNLIINAKQAMPEGGILRISAENVDGYSKFIVPLKPGRYIRVSIEDTGTGIPKDDLYKIFDPYFTTKPQGTGLGLATAYSIIKKHNGYIGVESREGEGTTFHIYLPAASETLINQEEDKETVLHKGRILVMDDERAVREVVTMMLEYLGYEVECASNGSEALDIYLNPGTPFDAVIMDLTIPGGMGGREAIMKFLEADPFVKAIVSSGYSNDPVMANYKQYGFSGIIAKPYKIEELGRVLHNVLKNEEDL